MPNTPVAPDGEGSRGLGPEIARYAAPAAFLAAATIAVVLIRAGMQSGDEAEPLPATTTAVAERATTAGTTAPVTTASPARYATVERGETLLTIADEHDTTVEALLELNPDVDPSALQVGQRVRVR